MKVQKLSSSYSQEGIMQALPSVMQNTPPDTHDHAWQELCKNVFCIIYNLYTIFMGRIMQKLKRVS